MLNFKDKGQLETVKEHIERKKTERTIFNLLGIGVLVFLIYIVLLLNYTVEMLEALY